MEANAAFSSYGDIIRILDMVFQGRHGCTASEREVGATFTVSVELFLDVSKAAENDTLDKTVDVAAAHDVVKEIVTGETLNLVETLAERIAADLLKAFDINAVRVRMHKDRSPMPGPTRGYEIELFRTA